MAKRLRTTPALAVVVMMLVGACAASTTSPTPAGSAAASQPAAPSASAAASQPAPSAAATAKPAAAVPTVPTGYTELDQALTRAPTAMPFNGKTVSIQTQWIGGEGTNFAAAVADFATATGIKIQIDSIGSSHETVLKTRIEGGKPPDLAMLAQPTPILAYAAAGKVKDVATLMDAQEAQRRACEHHRPGHPGLEHLGHPLQGRRQVDHLVPDQGLRGQGLHGPQDVGRADRPVRQDRRRRHQPVVRQRGRPRRPRPAGRSPTGSRKWSSRPRALDYYNDWISHKVTFQDPGIKDAFDKYVGKIFFTPKYVFGGNTAIVATDQKTPMDPMFTDDLANPKCWMQKIPTWYGPDFFPDQRASGQPSKYIIGTDVGIFPFPTIDPAQNICRGLGRHAHGARRSARSPCRRRVPRHAGRHPELDPRRQRHLDQHDHPRRLVCRRLQAQGRCRDREQRRRGSASTLPTSCPPRSAPEPSGHRRSSGPTPVAPTPMPF